jgi:hypothetical protein
VVVHKRVYELPHDVPARDDTVDMTRHASANLIGQLRPREACQVPADLPQSEPGSVRATRINRVDDVDELHCFYRRWHSILPSTPSTPSTPARGTFHGKTEKKQLH